MSNFQKYIIIDLDGTCFNIDHRLKHIVDIETNSPLPKKQKDYKKFFDNMDKDVPYKQMYIFLKTFVTLGFEPIFLTGRPEKYREETLESINKNFSLVDFDPFLIMRPEKNFDPDYICKWELLEEIIKIMGINPFFAIDDRDSVIEQFRSKGIITLDAKLINKKTPTL